MVVAIISIFLHSGLTLEKENVMVSSEFSLPIFDVTDMNFNIGCAFTSFKNTFLVSGKET